MVPDYRHADPPPLPDGDTVQRPDPERAPPLSIAERWWAVMFAAIALIAITVGVLR